SEDGQTTNDITHDWGPQHVSWNSGAMDGFLTAHLASDGPKNGFLTMGYFTRADLPFYHALADAFSVCDQYFCSVLGPTYPNRLVQMTGSLGADGSQGGPVLETYDDPVSHYGTMDWLTMPEVLTEAGVSWKVYQDPSTTVLYNVLPFFKNYASPTTSRDAEVAANGLTPQYPAQFVADVTSGALPAVSWILPPAACCEHPAAPPEYGEWLTSEILSTLVSNPDVWAKTVFLIVHDENGGWFDHVPPPSPGPLVTSRSEIPPDDAFSGEYITAPLPSSGTYTAGGESLSVYGPVGLGFRTPCLVISPFSRGGYLCSEVFDHVSVLKLISARFGAPVPNASQWRLETVGDMTGALALTMPMNTSVPSLPPTSIADPEVAAQAVVNAILGTEDAAPIDYPPPTSNSGIPVQESSPRRTRLPAGQVAGGGQGAGSGTTGAGPAGSSPGSHSSGAATGTSGASNGGKSARTARPRAPRPGSDLAASAASDRGAEDAGLAAAAVGGAVTAGLAAASGVRRLLPGSRRGRSDEEIEHRAVRGEALDVEA
ncbi:MAG: alkaline phosphatase family protein, partial [Acidimicrobiales bacterium]